MKEEQKQGSERKREREGEIGMRKEGRKRERWERRGGGGGRIERRGGRDPQGKSHTEH